MLFILCHSVGQFNHEETWLNYVTRCGLALRPKEGADPLIHHEAAFLGAKAERRPGAQLLCDLECVRSPIRIVGPEAVECGLPRYARLRPLPPG